MPAGAAILDAGCGSGRDSRTFRQRGYRVTSIDASQTMVESARQHAAGPVHQMRFQDLDFEAEFDGIWACASLLHLPRAELPPVLQRLHQATRPGGIVYVSFKHGAGERLSQGRHFSDFTPTQLQNFVDLHSPFEVLQIWETQDVRPGRSQERWVNALLQGGFPAPPAFRHP